MNHDGIGHASSSLITRSFIPGGRPEASGHHEGRLPPVGVGGEEVRFITRCLLFIRLIIKYIMVTD